MIHAWRLGADGGGIFFYLAVRIWMTVFGHSIIALRLFNATSMWLALALLWTAVRRWYRFELVAFSLPFCWLTAHSVLRQLMVGRFYGLLMATVALTVLCYSFAADHVKPCRTQLAAVFAANTLLVATHPFGLLYSAVILAGVFVLDSFRRRLRPLLYLATLCGWWILWPSRAAIAASHAVGNPHFWTSTPSLRDLTDALSFWTDELRALSVFVILCLVVHRLWIRRHRACISPAPADQAAITIGSSLMAVILLVWLLSQHGTSYFVDRYLVPTLLGAALLLCASLARLIPAVRSFRLSCVLAFATVAAVSGTVYSAIWDVPASFALPPHRYTSTMAALLPPGKLIVIQPVDIFAEAITSVPQLHFIHLLDWQTVLSPASPLGDVSGYHEMQNWQRSGYYAPNIQQSDLFLKDHPEFWVVTNASDQWFSQRILSTSAYTVQFVAHFQRNRDTETIWHVQRKLAPS
jgi:hypothetical protein